MKYVFEKVKNGETVTFNPKGNSMMPRIKSGQEITVSPLDETTKLEVGNVVLCKVKGRIFLHLISAIDNIRGFQISNNKGYVNGWTREICGIVKGI
jgi:hypothetical protein